jgi:hypothetical protein
MQHRLLVASAFLSIVCGCSGSSETHSVSPIGGTSGLASEGGDTGNGSTIDAIGAGSRGCFSTRLERVRTSFELL